jgi:hypothetical protein
MGTTQRSGVTRAARAWQVCAVHVRGELRAHGVHGHLRRLDDYAAGYRGTGIAEFLSDFVRYARAHGMPADRVTQHLSALVDEVVTAAYDDDQTQSA